MCFCPDEPGTKITSADPVVPKPRTMQKNTADPPRQPFVARPWGGARSNTLTALQEDLLVRSLSFLSAQSLLRVGAASRHLREYHLLPDLWMLLLRSDLAIFGVAPFLNRAIGTRKDIIRAAGDNTFALLYKKLYTCIRARVGEWTDARQALWERFYRNPQSKDAEKEMFRQRTNWDIFCSFSPFDQRHRPSVPLLEIVGGSMHNCIWQCADSQGGWTSLVPPNIDSAELSTPVVLLHLALDIVVCQAHDPFRMRLGRVDEPMCVPRSRGVGVGVTLQFRK